MAGRPTSVLANGVSQIRECFLAVPDNCAYAVLNHSAFEIDRLPGRWGQINSGDVFDHPPVS
jgi:hypothetical protein